MENLQANLTLIQQRLAAASDGKYPVPKLIAVTKTHPAEDILPLQNLGVTDIGENKVQEIMEKLPALEKNFRIHLIGRLQSCLLYTSPSPRDYAASRMPSSA